MSFHFNRSVADRGPTSNNSWRLTKQHYRSEVSDSCRDYNGLPTLLTLKPCCGTGFAVLCRENFLCFGRFIGLAGRCGGLVTIPNSGARNFHSGTIAQGVWGWKSPVRSRGEAPSRGSGCRQIKIWDAPSVPSLPFFSPFLPISSASFPFLLLFLSPPPLRSRTINTARWSEGTL